MDQGHKLLGNPALGGACPRARTTQTLGAEEGEESLGLAVGTAQQLLQFSGSACVQANICQSNHGLVGVFLAPSVLGFRSCSGPATLEMLTVHPAHCSLLCRVSSQGSSWLELAVPQPSAFVQCFLLVLQAVRPRACCLPLE